MTSKYSWIVVTVTILTLLAPWAAGQGQDSSSKEPQPQEGINASGFNIRQSIELGGRIAEFDGDRANWATFVNLDSGPRLLEHSLEMRALKGSGAIFDDLSLYSFGYGGDPNNLTRLRVTKNRWFDFRGQFRRDRNYFDYNLLANPFNPLPGPAVSTFPTDSPIVLPSSGQTIVAENNVVPFSPHLTQLTRRMTDLDLTIAPQRVVSVRLGYSHNRMYGPSYVTFSEGAGSLLFQDWSTLSNRAYIGIDVNALPRTRISFDQSFDWYRQDTSAVDGNFGYQLNDGSFGSRPIVDLADLGIVLERIGATSSQPCFNPLQGTAPTGPPEAIDPTCNGFLFYQRTQPIRNRYPTQKLAFQTNYWKFLEVDFTAMYSSGRSQATFGELFEGRISRTNQRSFNVFGPVDNERKSKVVDFGLTAHLTDRIRFNDKFSWYDFRIPGFFGMTELSLFGPSMAVQPITYNPATCDASIPDFSGCPTHNTSSPADIAVEDIARLLAQDSKQNLAELAFDVSTRFGLRAGWRWRQRDIIHNEFVLSDLTFYPGPTAANAQRGGCTLADTDPTGVCRLIEEEVENEEFAITEHAFVAGLWARPVDAVRLNFDVDLTSADNTFTRLTPRKVQQYKLRVNVKPNKWINLGGMVNIWQAQNRTAGIEVPGAPQQLPSVDYTSHNRNYGFTASFLRGDRFTLDLAYNFNDFESENRGICFYDYEPGTLTLTGPGEAVPVGPAGGAEGDATSTCEPARIIRGGVPQILFGNFFFDNKVHTGSANVLFKPVKRVTTGFGYTLTSSRGLLPDLLSQQLAPLPVQPDIPDQNVSSINWHLPTAMIAIEINPRWTFRTQWQHYGYNEKLPASSLSTDPGNQSTPLRSEPRDFRGNVFTLSARYAF